MREKEKGVNDSEREKRDEGEVGKVRRSRSRVVAERGRGVGRKRKRGWGRKWGTGEDGCVETGIEGGRCEWEETVAGREGCW